jgi:hypothetical protein
MVQRNGIHLSKMSGKLEGFLAISSNTTTNPYCITKNSKAKPNNICGDCYSWAMLNSYRKNMTAALQYNSDLLSQSVLDYEDLPSLLVSHIRFNAHGELINITHLTNLVNVAKKNPHCRCVLWTKRNDYVSKYFKLHKKPDNFSMVYSNPIKSTIMRKVPKHFDKTFNNVLTHEYLDEQNCTGQKCKDCMICYTENDTTVIVEKVKKY